MILAHSPSIVTNGLVLAYDMNNTSRSWMGAPTTNLTTFDIAVSGFNTDAPGNLTQTGSSSEMKYRGRLSRKMVVGAGYWNSYIYTYNTSVSSTVFALSFKVKVQDGSHPNTFMSGGYIYGSVGSFYPALSFTAIDDGWYLAYCTYSGTSMTLNSLTGMNGTSPGAKTFYLTDYQIEALTITTPFVTGTRSSTQALLDLTGQNTLSASSLTYASDNTFSFNATGNYITLPTSIGYTTTVSAFAWIKTAGTPRGGYHIICGTTELEISIPTAGDLRTGVVTSGTRYVSNHGSGLTSGTWHYCGFTFDGSTKISYIDGANVGSIGTVGTLTSSISGRSMGIFGVGDATYGMNGMIGQFTVYNRALSATEVAQNFQALRGRYGL